ncbi:MAG: leucine-rich repeat protein, partial [Candidatus Cryptobacteroides sp.]
MKKAVYILSAFLMCACAKEMFPDSEKTGEAVPIALNGQINQEYVTRADQYGFADGDVIGTYIVDYEDGLPGTLQLKGNRADNLYYTYNEPGFRWVPAYDVYYKDDKTPVDIYAYYPASDPESVSSYGFEVALNQRETTSSGVSGYESSDFLWAKAEGKTSADRIVWLNFTHKMAGVKVTLVQGSGFEEGEWDATDRDVLIRNTAREARIDLSTGDVTAKGEADYKGIIPQSENGIFRAVVVPQSVKAGEVLMTATVGGYSYDLVRQADMTYTGGRQHNFTLTVNKRDSGGYEFEISSEGISDWENDKYSHEGTAREYVIVDVSTPGTIDAVISASGRQVSKVRNLKVTGRINKRDFEVMNKKMVSLSALNLKEVIIVGDDGEESLRIPTEAFAGKYSLTSIVLPDRLLSIGYNAFCNTNLTGSLIIPEGVELLEECCFAGCKSLTGQLYLPSTLKYIGTMTDKYEGNGVFYGCGFVCQLNLPDCLETICSGAFSNCRNIYGEIHIPETVQAIGYRAFAFMDNVTGSLKIPQNVTIIAEDCFNSSGFNGVLILHDGIVNIECSAFASTKLKGELHLPKNIEVINNDAFSGCDFSGSLVIPGSVSYIGSRAFQNNSRLTGTVVIPEGVLSIGSRAFANCSMLEGVIFPESLENILNTEGGAFENCFGLGRIVCKSRIPPMIQDNCFEGVAKDNFVLEVPQGCEQQYRTATGWNLFKRIGSSRRIAVDRACLSALNSAVTRNFTLYAEEDWKMESAPDWVSLNSIEGSGKTEMELTFDEKPHDGKNRNGEVVFSLASGDYQTSVELVQYDCDNGEDAWVQLQKAVAGSGINVIVLCDGFSALEVSLGTTAKIASQVSESLLGIAPFSTFRDRFNVWTAASVSIDSGVNSLNAVVDTRFGCMADGASVTVTDIDGILDYAAGVTSEDGLARTLIIIVPNTDDYDGSVVMDDRCLGIACCPMTEYGYPMDFRGMVQYWAGGRAFGCLADESVRYNSIFPYSEELQNAHSDGRYRNVSASGKVGDAPWKDFIRHPLYSSFVDLYEGAMECSRGIYRSEQNSCMCTRIP